MLFNRVVFFIFFSTFLLQNCQYSIAQDPTTLKEDENGLAVNTKTKAKEEIINEEDKLISDYRKQDSKENKILIKDIIIYGHSRTEKETVIAYFGLEKGSEATKNEIELGIDRLFDSGLFSNVEIKIDQSIVYIKVIENPVVNKIAFEGNNSIESQQIKESIQHFIASGRVLKVHMVKTIANEIKKSYSARSYFSASIIPKIIKRKNNFVDLVFEIKEGKQARARRVVFNIMNDPHKMFGDRELLSITGTVYKWYTSIFSSADFNPSQIEVDAKLIQRIYQAYGFVYAKVTSGVASLDWKNSSFHIVYNINVGNRYILRNAKLQIVGKPKKLMIKEINEEVYKIVGVKDYYDITKIERSKNIIWDILGKYGYSAAEIDYKVEKVSGTNMVDVVFIIDAGKKVFINDVSIFGNTKTSSSVILDMARQMKPGGVIDFYAIRKSIRELNGSGFFDSADIKNVPSDLNADGIENIRIEIEEKKKTESITFSASVNSIDKFGANCKINLQNFMGKGYDTGAEVTVYAKNQTLSSTLFNRSVMNSNVGYGIVIVGQKIERLSAAGFKQSEVAMDHYIVVPLTEDLRLRVGNKLSLLNLYNDNNDPKIEIEYENKLLGNRIINNSYASLTIYGNLDNFYDPTKGMLLQKRIDLYNIITENKSIKLELSLDMYKRLVDQSLLKVYFAFKANCGFMFLNPLPKSMLFNLGGDTMRGFTTFGISPKWSDGSYIGGKYFYSTRTLLRVPLVQNSGLRAVGGIDAGSVFGSYINHNGILSNKHSLRISIFSGLEWLSPFGAFCVTIGVPIKKKPHDGIQYLQISGIL